MTRRERLMATLCNESVDRPPVSFYELIGQAASLFPMEDFTIIAMTNQELFHRLLERFATTLWAQIEALPPPCPADCDAFAIRSTPHHRFCRRISFKNTFVVMINL